MFSRAFAVGCVVAPAVLALSGCNKADPAATAVASAAQQHDRPPQVFLDDYALAPALFGSDLFATDVTVGQIADYYGSSGAWRKIDEATYILDVSQTDEITHKPIQISLEFIPGRPTAGRCDNCSGGQGFVQIRRGVLDGNEMDADDIGNVESTVFKAHIPLSPTALAAKQQREAAAKTTLVPGGNYGISPPPPGDAPSSSISGNQSNTPSSGGDSTGAPSATTP